MNIPATIHLTCTSYRPWLRRESDAARLSIEHIRASGGALLATSDPGPSNTQTKQATTEETES